MSAKACLHTSITAVPLYPQGLEALSLQLLIWRSLCSNMSLKKERYCLPCCHQSAPDGEEGLALWFAPGLGVELERLFSTDICGSGNQHRISEHWVCALFQVPSASQWTAPSAPRGQSPWMSHTSPSICKVLQEDPTWAGRLDQMIQLGFLSTSITLQFCV